MRITIAALGTRGDVQPMIALGRGLQAVGHQVTLVAGSNFVDWISSFGLACVPAGDVEALMQSEKGTAWAGSSGNPMQQLRMMRALLEDHAAEMYAPLLGQADDSDLFVTGFVAEAWVQAICEARGLPYVGALLQPQLPTRSGPASITAPIPRGRSVLNLWAGRLAQRLLWSVAAPSANRLRTQVLGLPAHSAASFARAGRRAPALLGFSRHVVPPATDWPKHMLVTGYWLLDEVAHDWQPSDQLAAFLDAGEPPVYVGFGSMSSRAPEQTVELIESALRRSGRRAVIAAGWAGLAANTRLERSIVVGSVPHAWLFERVAAVVHHGGAGTTAAGLRAGRPTMIVPHMSDQPYWGRRVYELSVGVKPVPRHRLTSDALASGIEQLLNNSAIEQRAAALGERIRAEGGLAAAVDAVERLSAAPR